MQQANLLAAPPNNSLGNLLPPGFYEAFIYNKRCNSDWENAKFQPIPKKYAQHFVMY